MGNDITACSFYDAAGRLAYSTKIFVDNSYKREFLPGDLQDPGFMTQLKDDYFDDIKAYTKTEYWDDPLGRVKKVSVPGTANEDIYSRSWTFGVDATVASKVHTISTGTTVTFVHGVITTITFSTTTFPKIENLFDQMYADFLTTNPFLASDNPLHVLTVTIDPEEKISEHLTDIFGNMEKTFAGATINAVDNGNIASSYEYDISGNVVKELPPVTTTNTIDVTEYKYNTRGQLIWKKTPDGGDHFVKRYVYDPLGRLWWVEQGKPLPNGSYDFDQKLVEYTYDHLGRIDTTRLPAISVDDYYTKYNYDILERITDRNTYCGSSSPVEKFKEAATFLKSDNITSVMYNYAALGKTFDEAYVYDSHYRLAAAIIASASGSVVNNVYEFDELGLFKRKKEGRAGDITGYLYHAGNNRLRQTVRNNAEEKEYIYDQQGNLAVDYNKNLVIHYDWRNLPIVFRFYDDLGDAGLTKEIKGSFAGDDLYSHMETRVADDQVELLSSVYMLYNADGKRVCKMAVKE